MSKELKIKDEEIRNEAYVLELYLEQYGNIDLDTLIKNVQGARIHECPKCKGKGEILRSEYDSWRYKMQYWYPNCDLCDGYGYTEKEKKPKMVIDRWD